MANEHITVGSNSYEKVKTFKKSRLFVHESKLDSPGNKMLTKVGNVSYYSVQIL